MISEPSEEAHKPWPPLLRVMRQIKAGILYAFRHDSWLSSDFCKIICWYGRYRRADLKRLWTFNENTVRPSYQHKSFLGEDRLSVSRSDTSSIVADISNPVSARMAE